MGFGAAFVLAAAITAPVFHRLQLTSVYEYFELRYQSKSLRRLSMVIGMVLLLLYKGVILYGAAVALDTFLGFPVLTSMVFMELFTVIYTGIGGIKSVVWTDVVQSVVLIVGITAVLIKGTINIGGLKDLYRLNMEGGRLNVLNFDFDPTTRNTIWTLTFGSAIRMINLGFHPSTIQRMNAVPRLKDARLVLMLAGIFCFFIEFIFIAAGLVAFAYFSKIKCDPFESKQLSNPNQILPFLVIHLFSEIPGLVGIFLAALLSACLSTISSLLISFSALFSEDIMKSCFSTLSDRYVTLSAKLSVPIFGVIATGFGIMVSQMKGPLTQIYMLFVGACSGPLTAIFLLSIFIPGASALGVFLAGAIGICFSTWLIIGRFSTDNAKLSPPPLPSASVDKCLVNLTQQFNGSSLQYDALDYPVGIDYLYSVSYQAFGVLSIGLTFLVGLLTIYLTRSRAPKTVPKNTTLNFRKQFCCCLKQKSVLVEDPKDEILELMPSV